MLTNETNTNWVNFTGMTPLHNSVANIDIEIIKRAALYQEHQTECDEKSGNNILRFIYVKR